MMMIGSKNTFLYRSAKLFEAKTCSGGRNLEDVTGKGEKPRN